MLLCPAIDKEPATHFEFNFSRREDNGACDIFSQQAHAMRGRTIRFATKRPGTYTSGGDLQTL